MKKLGFSMLAIAIVAITAAPSWAEKRTVFVEAPDTCYTLGKVEGNKVYLEYTGKNCMKIRGKLEAQIDRSIRMMDLYDNGVFWKKQSIVEFSPDGTSAAIIDAQKKGTEDASKVVLDTKKINEGVGMAAAKEVDKIFKGDEVQREIAKGHNAALDLFGDQLKGAKDLKRPENDDSRQPDQILPSSERIYVFISSSVPIETLRQLFKSVSLLEEERVSVVMTGPIGGMKYIKPTYEFLAKIAKKDPSCETPMFSGVEPCEMYTVNFLLDPILFRRYEITEVPAIVYARDVNVVDTKGTEGLSDNVAVGNYYKVYGDATLQYSLEVLQRASKSIVLEKLLKKAQKGYY